MNNPSQPKSTEQKPFASQSSSGSKFNQEKTSPDQYRAPQQDIKKDERVGSGTSSQEEGSKKSSFVKPEVKASDKI